MTGFATPAETPAARQQDRSSPSEVSSELVRELDEWKRAGRKARIWLRDDDAVSDTAELRRLLALAEEVRTVIGLAVIPERADESLVKRVASGPCCVWQHGWAHHWQYEDDEQSYSQGEFGAGRDLELMVADARKGQARLDRLFGEQGWQRVFVPPFHAFCVPFKMLLPSLGYRGLSAGDPLTPPVQTVAEVNAEIDIINWRKRKFRGSDTISGLLTEQLRSRRQGRMEFEAPIGLLTHHLAMDEPAWRYMEELFRFLARHDAVELPPADRLFAQAPGEPQGRSRPVAADGAETAPHEEVTMVVTSCGRQDLLERTLDSFLQHNTYPIKEIIVIEDGDGDLNLPLMDKYREHPITWLATGHRVGQVAAIDIAYKAVTTDYIFHCEDDWQFFAPGFIEKSMVVLAQNHSILQVWLRALKDTNLHPVMKFELTAEGIPHRLLRHHHDMGEWGVWHGFSWNPGLRRRRDYDLLGSFGSLDPESTKESWQVESDASIFYQQRGFVAAILSDRGGKGYVRHLGRGRRVPRDFAEPSAEAELPVEADAPPPGQPAGPFAKHKAVQRLRRWRDKRLIANSSLFDRTWYLERYGDVRSAGVDPIWHYLAYGASEGRDPGPDFDSNWYLTQNQDVRRAEMNPLVHYLRHGQSEGRQPRPLRSSQTPGANRDQYARRLMARLSAYPKFARVPQVCAMEHQAGIDEAPGWQIWTSHPTTKGQLRIEEQLESLINPSSSILHIGAGNSSLGQRIAPRVAKVLATTLHDEEKVFSERLGVDGYSVVRANKFSDEMDHIEGHFDFIVDPNPSTFACCLFHFSRMLVSYTELLKKDGGLFITEKRGLKWVSTGNDPNWSFGWDEWARIGDILQMPVVQVTDQVYSMQRRPESGLVSLDLCDRVSSRVD